MGSTCCYGNHLHGDVWGDQGKININLLAPCRFEWNLRLAISNHFLAIDGLVISCNIALRWMSLDFTTDQSINLDSGSSQASSHYLSQSWPKFMMPYGIIRLQWVNSLAPRIGDVAMILKVQYLNSLYGIAAWVLAAKCSQVNVTELH